MIKTKQYLLDTNILIEYALKKKGKPVDEFDMVIAGHALSEGLTVVTDNIKHFENMPDVKVENWMER